MIEMTKKWEYLAVDLYPYSIRGGHNDERRYRCRRLDKEAGRIHFVRAPDGHNHLEKPLLEWLNEFGEEGWEMVALTTGYGSKSKSGSSGRYTFKRKIV
jgi:hypothetical protein